MSYRTISVNAINVNETKFPSWRFIVILRVEVKQSFPANIRGARLYQFRVSPLPRCVEMLQREKGRRIESSSVMSTTFWSQRDKLRIVGYPVRTGKLDRRQSKFSGLSLCKPSAGPRVYLPIGSTGNGSGVAQTA